MTQIILNNGVKMPIIGLGTFKIKGSELVKTSLESAVAAGYRAIDTAGVYKNEVDIGRSINDILPQHGLTRSDIFITSKLGPKDHGKEKCRAACLKSIADLQCEYLDLYLIHWPGGQGLQPSDIKHKQLRQGSWQAMEDLYEEGKIRAIGVSNYLQRHLEELLEYCRVRPVVLQVEYHPHLVQHQLVEFCKKNKITFQAYSSLGTSDTENKLLKDEVVNRIAKSLSKTSAQILLRWAVQQNIGVIPKSTNINHLQENIDIFSFSLSDDDMKSLTSLNQSQHYCWNPECVL
ncbi:glyoxal reductase isoform X1 [Patella vulgata]|uniref:glyoxal reductase isoform X1 n=1 Tax=Patella vulgata TaxID=6465 RepID=UPI00217F2E1E|nr:glyoxal reductase isoform X1 [Patella vulgata]